MPSGVWYARVCIDGALVDDKDKIWSDTVSFKVDYPELSFSAEYILKSIEVVSKKPKI